MRCPHCARWHGDESMNLAECPACTRLAILEGILPAKKAEPDAKKTRRPKPRVDSGPQRPAQ